MNKLKLLWRLSVESYRRESASKKLAKQITVALRHAPDGHGPSRDKLFGGGKEYECECQWCDLDYQFQLHWEDYLK